jgi:hypothetical protein
VDSDALAESLRQQLRKRDAEIAMLKTDPGRAACRARRRAKARR